MLDYLTFISSELIQPLWGRLQKVRGGRQKLITRIEDEFGDPRALAKYYVEPYCQNDNPADFDEEEPIPYVSTPAFDVINRFFNRDFKIVGDGRNQMFILADAGMGKTSFLMMIALSHILKFWPDRFTCKLLKIGPDTIDEVCQMKNRSSTILLLDALDEDRSAWGNLHKRAVEILQATRLFRRVIITCRTQFFPKRETVRVGSTERVEIGGFRCPLIFLSLFDERQISEYLSRRFSREVSSSERERKMADALDLLDQIGTLSMRPLLLAHIEDLLGADRETWNSYTVYQQLIDVWLLREERKIRQQRPDVEVSKRGLCSACVATAGFMQSRGRRTISDVDLKSIVSKVPEISNLEYVDVGGRSLLNRNSYGEFRFSHYAIQEFLVALGVVCPEVLPFRVKGQHLTVDTLGMISAGIREVSGDSERALVDGWVLPGIDLSYFNMSGLDLQGADLAGAQLKGALFRKALLRGVSLAGVDLSGARMAWAEMPLANIHAGCLVEANLQDCNLEGTVFEEADLTRADLERASAREAVFKEATMIGVCARGCNFVNADLRDVKAHGANFQAAKLVQARMTLGDFREATFKGAIMKKADLREADLRGAEFIAINDRGVHSKTLDKKVVNDKKQCDLEEAHLQKANLSGADMEDASLKRTNLRGANLVDANLRGAELQGANLQDANLQGANLQGAKLGGAKLHNANLSSAVVGIGQLEAAVGNHRTRLPVTGWRPKNWD